MDIIPNLNKAELNALIDGLESQQDWECWQPNAEWLCKHIAEIYRASLELEQLRAENAELRQQLAYLNEPPERG